MTEMVVIHKTLSNWATLHISQKRETEKSHIEFRLPPVSHYYTIVMTDMHLKCDILSNCTCGCQQQLQLGVFITPGTLNRIHTTKYVFKMTFTTFKLGSFLLLFCRLLWVPDIVILFFIEFLFSIQFAAHPLSVTYDQITELIFSRNLMASLYFHSEFALFPLRFSMRNSQVEFVSKQEILQAFATSLKGRVHRFWPSLEWSFLDMKGECIHFPVSFE